MGEIPTTPAPIQPEPIALADLFDLFVRPAQFFAGRIALGRKPAVMFVAWVVGVANVLGIIDQKLLQDAFRRSHDFADVLADMPNPLLWALILAAGALGGLLIYQIGGWWYWVRLDLSGVNDPDSELAHHVQIYAGFVADAPVVLVSLIQTVRYGNYVSAAYAGAGLLDLAPVIAAFWSVFVSWKGVRAAFPAIRRRPATVWFLILPCLFFLVIMGAGSALLVLFSRRSA